MAKHTLCEHLEKLFWNPRCLLSTTCCLDRRPGPPRQAPVSLLSLSPPGSDALYGTPNMHAFISGPSDHLIRCLTSIARMDDVCLSAWQSPGSTPPYSPVQIDCSQLLWSCAALSESIKSTLGTCNCAYQPRARGPVPSLPFSHTRALWLGQGHHTLGPRSDRCQET